MVDRQPETTYTIEDRLSEISRLEAGWCWGEGSPVNAQALRTARRMRDLAPALLVAQAGRASIFPTIEGGISIEHGDLAQLDLEIAPDGTIEAVPEVPGSRIDALLRAMSSRA